MSRARNHARRSRVSSVARASAWGGLATFAVLAACGSSDTARFIELPSVVEAKTLVLGRSFRSGAALTHATVYDRTKATPVVFEHDWDPANAEVLSAYFYDADVHALDLVAGELDPPPLGREADGRTLRSPNDGFELVLEDGGDPRATWGPATLGLLARYVFFVPPLECPNGQHDGGDRTCRPEGECSSTYRDGGGGICVPVGTCAPDYYLGRDGDCLPACPMGYYITRTGICCGERAQVGSSDCIEPCTYGQKRSPSRDQGCVPESWCCDAASCTAPPC